MDVEVLQEGPISLVGLNRLSKRNALSLAFMSELDQVVREQSANPTVRVIVVKGNGPVFSAGHDLGEMAGQGEEFYQQLFAQCGTLMATLRGIPQPVIAAIDGVATAAGCQLVAGCDLAVASDRSTFATPGVRIGLFCSTPMVPIARAIGMKRALEMLLTGEPISAQTALEWGLVNRVVDAGRLEAAVVELAHAIAHFSADTIALGKRAFYEQLAMSEPAAYERMTAVMVDNAQRPAAREGMAAFLEKRAPHWPDRTT